MRYPQVFGPNFRCMRTPFIHYLPLSVRRRVAIGACGGALLLLLLFARLALWPIPACCCGAALQSKWAGSGRTIRKRHHLVMVEGRLVPGGISPKKSAGSTGPSPGWDDHMSLVSVGAGFMLTVKRSSVPLAASPGWVAPSPKGDLLLAESMRFLLQVGLRPVVVEVLLVPPPPLPLGGRPVPPSPGKRGRVASLSCPEKEALHNARSSG